MDVNQNCKITNNSGKTLLVLDAYNSATDTENNSTKQGYEQDLKILEPASGGDSIATGASGTVTLDDTRVEDGKTKPNYLYQLLLSDPATLFPIANLGVSLDFDSLGYPDQTVAKAQATNMSLGLTFYQSMLAFPTSNLAKGFGNVMQSAQKESSPSDIFTAVANYFNTTTSFKGLDFGSYIAVSTYMSGYASYWGMDDKGNAGRTYYIYKAADSAATADKGTKCVNNLGSIVFAQNSGAPNPADPTDRDSGYSITFEPSDGSSSVALTFVNGVLVDKSDPDASAINLQGTFAVKSQFTGEAGDTNPWPVFVGKMSGSEVMASSNEPATGFTKFVTCKSFKDWFDLFMQAMGLWMALDFLKSKLSAKEKKLEDDKTNKNEGKDPTDDQKKQADQDADKVGDDAKAQEQKINEDIGGAKDNVPDGADLAGAQDNLRAPTSEVNNALAGDNYSSSIDEYKGQIDELSQIGVNDALEDAEGNLIDAKGNLPDAVANGDFSDVQSDLGDVKTNVDTAVKELDPGQETLDKIKESNDAIKEFDDNAKEAEEQSENAKDGEGEFEPEVE